MSTPDAIHVGDPQRAGTTEPPSPLLTVTEPIPDLDALSVADPRGRTEEVWLDVFEHLLASLSAMTRAKIEIGAYWLDVGSTGASASLGARIRADGPLLWTGSDCWEAAFCITGGGDGAHVDVIAFPFLRGSVLTRHGRIQDLEGDHEVEEFWLHFAKGRWEDRGWHSPEGAGEWDHVRRPGGAFFRGVSCSTARARFTTSEPLIISVARSDDGDTSLGDHASLSIHRLLRDGREILEAPSMAPVPRPGSSLRRPLGATMLPAAFRLDSVPVPGGWGPGQYQLEARLNYARGPTSCDSDISEATQFEVVE